MNCLVDLVRLDCYCGLPIFVPWAFNCVSVHCPLGHKNELEQGRIGDRLKALEDKLERKQAALTDALNVAERQRVKAFRAIKRLDALTAKKSRRQGGAS